MKYYIFLDDSGQLHYKYPHGNYFIYGGLLIKEQDLHGINKSYRNFIKNIKKQKGINGELKTVKMDIPTRRRMLKRLARYSCEQVFVTVNIRNLVRLNFDNKKDVVRYKNYVIRRLIDRLITTKKIPDSCELIELNIDNQNIAHSAKDSLEDHLINFFNEENYYLIHKQYDTTSFRTDFKVFYKDSKTNYLLQAADLLANTMFNALHSDTNKRKTITKLFKRGYTVVNLP